jgi:hypothetical protein
LRVLSIERTPERKLQTEIRIPDGWDDPFCWGIALWDIVRHLCIAYSGNEDKSIEARILEGFTAERERQTTTIEPLGMA